MRPIRITIKPTAANASNLYTGSPGAGAITLLALAAGPIDNCITGPNVNGVNLGLGRIIILTSGGNDNGIAATLKGTDQNGLPVTETIAALGSGSAVASVNFYTSLTSVTHTGSVATTLTIGTTNATLSAQTQTYPLDLYARVAPVLQVDHTGTIVYYASQTFDDCISTQANLQKNVYFKTPGLLGGTTFGTFSSGSISSADNYDSLTPGVNGLSLTIISYTSTASLRLNVTQPANSNMG